MSEENIESLIKFPLKFDEYGQKFVFDGDGNMFIEVRGFGRLQYDIGADKSKTFVGYETASKRQDAIGNWITRTLNESRWNVIESDGLPKEDRRYLLQLLYSNKYTEFEFADFYDGGFYGGRNNDEPVEEEGYCKVIAWRELPAAYVSGECENE